MMDLKATTVKPMSKSTDKRVSIRVNSLMFNNLTLSSERVLFRRLVGVSNVDIDQMLSYLLDRQSNFQAKDWSLRQKVSTGIRNKMFNWMMEITHTFKLCEYTLLEAITLLDNYYMKSDKKFTDDDVHLCGMCCLFIASKE